MEYSGVVLPNLISVNEIMSVYDFDFSKILTGKRGESHNFPEIIYIYEGEHKLLLNGHLLEMKAGDMVIYAPMAFHQGQKRTSEAKALIISFRCSFEPMEEIYNRVITLTEENRARITELIEGSLSMFRRAGEKSKRWEMRLREDSDIYEAEIIKKKLEIFLLSVYSENRQKNKNISGKHQKEGIAVAEFLKENVRENFTLEEIAERNAMSVSKLKKVFRECFGCGPVAYHIDMKIEEAKRLFFEEKYNVTQVSEMLGFRSLHYFSRLFKSKLSVSPSEYVRSLNSYSDF